MENILIEIAKSYVAKFGKPTTTNVIANTLGVTAKLTDPGEVAYVQNIFEYLVIKHNEAIKAAEEPKPVPRSQPLDDESVGANGPPAVQSALVRDDDVPPKWRVGSEGWWQNVIKKTPEQNKTLAHHLKGFTDNEKNDWKNWMFWIQGSIDAQMTRLRWIINWSEGGMTEGLDENSAIEAKEFLKELQTSIRKGSVTDLGKKTLEKKQADINWIKQELDKQPVTPVRSLYELFAKYFPPRRSSDFDNFWVREKHGEDDMENSWSLSEQTLKFCSYKNSEKYGTQIFTMEQVAKIVYCTRRLQLGIDYLNSIKPDTRVMRTANWTSQFVHWNKVSCNAYRHFYESVVAQKIETKSDLALLRYWLCHEPGTATIYYTHDV
jgi:hypothetical protein